MDVSQSHFVSALTVVFLNSKPLSSIKMDDTPVDDPSLKVLVANNSDTLKLLKMSSCPHVSHAGQCSDCTRVRFNRTKHAKCEHTLTVYLRIDVVNENLGQTQFHTIKKSSWDALIHHSSQGNIVMYFLLDEEEFQPFFREDSPVTHLWSGGQ
ncbi:unnamed protein product [Leuciscus chuanchicus]